MIYDGLAAGPVDLQAGGSVAAAADPSVDLALDISRWAGYAGLVLLGGIWVVATVWPLGARLGTVRRILWAGLGLTGAATLAEIVLGGVWASGRGFEAVTDFGLLAASVNLQVAQVVRLTVLAAFAVLLSLARERTSVLGVGLWPAWAALAVTFALTGHPRASGWETVLADTLHVTAMAAWLGGLVMLVAAVLPLRDPAVIARVLPAVSAVATGSVIVLAVTGTFSAARYLGSIGALVTTDYGHLIVLKSALFGAALLLGNISRTIIERRLGRGAAPGSGDGSATGDRARGTGDAASAAPGSTMVAERTAAVPGTATVPRTELERMMRSVQAELALSAILLIATAVLVSTPHP